jgi:hypothetical protein
MSFLFVNVCSPSFAIDGWLRFGLVKQKLADGDSKKLTDGEFVKFWILARKQDRPSDTPRKIPSAFFFASYVSPVMDGNPTSYYVT